MTMTWWQSIILGFVQGATEFLPISSSGHLILVRYWTGLSGDFFLFDSLVHFATLIAIVIVLFKDILKLFRPPFKTFGMIVVASVPAVITGFLLELTLKDYFESPKFLWVFFFITAAVLVATEVLAKRGKKAAADGEKTAADESLKPLWEMQWKNAVGMGLAQAAAVFPGLSRSGSTIFGGVVTKGDRGQVAKFSFLMSIPVILGAVALELYKLGDAAAEGVLPAVTVPWYAYLLGMATAFAVGFFAIKFMLRLIQKANFKWFAVYLAALGTVTLVLYFILGL